MSPSSVLLAALLGVLEPTAKDLVTEGKGHFAETDSAAIAAPAAPALAMVEAPSGASEGVTRSTPDPAFSEERSTNVRALTATDVSIEKAASTNEASSAQVAGKAKTDKKPLKTWVAVQSDIGIPDGLGVSAVVTPFEWLRLQFGAVGNGGNAGVRGGIALLPHLWVVRPTLTIDAGRIFSGDPNAMLRDVLPESLKPLLQGVAWTFASARVGLEVGTRRGAVQLQVGGSYFDVEVPGVVHVAESLGTGTRFTGGAPHIQKFIPSIRVGLIVALF